MRAIEHRKRTTAALRAAALLVMALGATAPASCVMQRSAVAPGGDPMVITEKQIAQV